MISKNIDIVFVVLLLIAAAVFGTVKETVISGPGRWHRTIIAAPVIPQPPAPPRILFE